MKLYSTLLLIACLIALPVKTLGQEAEIVKQGIPIAGDTTVVLSKKELKRQKKAQRNVHYNILGGPSYTPDFGFLIGGSALVTFSMNPKDSTMKRSVVPASVALMFKGGLNIVVKPQLFFKNDKFRIFGQFIYKNTQENYYGVGYTTNKNYIRGKETSQYKYSGIQVNPWFLFRIKETNFFAGPQIDLNYDHMMNVAEGITQDKNYIKAGGTADGYSNFSSGLGFLLSYDTRDIPANPFKGLYLWTVQSKNVFGNNIPLNKYVLSGTPFDLRGYYMGQFRDKSSHLAILEYRQMFNTDRSNWWKKVANRLGYVVWGGSGFMGPNPGKIEGVLPNAGVGLRIEVQPRMNFRLDIGRDFVNKQNLFYINMTEAF